jgi:hypothetical protein
LGTHASGPASRSPLDELDVVDDELLEVEEVVLALDVVELVLVDDVVLVFVVVALP